MTPLLTRAAETVPRFENYPVRQFFQGAPAPPRLVASWARQYQTMIRQGVEKGWGVQQEERHDMPGPNFAGHYIVITWGCGAGCLRMVIVDAVSGKVYAPPLSHSRIGNDRIALRREVVGPVQVEYRRNSRLFMMHDCPINYNHTQGSCDQVYFVMGPTGFKFLRRVPGEQFEPEPSTAPR